MAKKKRKRKVKKTVKIPAGWVVKETEKDLKHLDNLYEKSCERCGVAYAGRHKPMSRKCVKCISVKDSPEFELKKGLE